MLHLKGPVPIGLVDHQVLLTRSFGALVPSAGLGTMKTKVIASSIAAFGFAVLTTTVCGSGVVTSVMSEYFGA